MSSLKYDDRPSGGNRNNSSIYVPYYLRTLVYVKSINNKKQQNNNKNKANQ